MSEYYRYLCPGQRIEKMAVAQRVRYLPGLECRQWRDAAHENPVWQVLNIHAAQVICVAGRNQLRYSCEGHHYHRLLELDNLGKMLSHEAYYPYGGTAWWASRSQVDSLTKTRRYSGKERDATGMLYYGYRYLVAWLLRWLAPDPAGALDGLNLWRFCRNNPVTLGDRDGRMADAEDNQAEAPSSGVKPYTSADTTAPATSADAVWQPPRPMDLNFTRQLTEQVHQALSVAPEIPSCSGVTPEIPPAMPSTSTAAVKRTYSTITPACKQRVSRKYTGYPCNHEGCSQTFRSQAELITHKLDHSGFETIKCSQPGCQWQTRRKGCLVNHLRGVHNITITFDCLYCPLIFQCEMALERHVNKKHPLPKYRFKCAECSAPFTDAALMMEHGITEQHQVRYPCSYAGCNDLFLTTQARGRHNYEHFMIKPQRQPPASNSAQT